MDHLHKTLGVLALAAVGCGGEPGGGTSLAEIPPTLRVECAAESGDPPGADWTCPESVQLDCSAPRDGVLRVVSPRGDECDADALSVTYTEPLTPGTHRVTVRDERDVALCTSNAIVRRSGPLQLVSKHPTLWPPNHKLHEIRVQDCVEIVGACPGEQLSGRFIWASSDEPEDAKGDGNKAPDILLSDDCQQLSLRSERQGPSDGRVYTLGVRMVDGTGETYEGSCSVSVVHDQSGAPAVAGSDAYRLDFDGTTPGLPSCTEDSALL